MQRTLWSHFHRFTICWDMECGLVSVPDGSLVQQSRYSSSRPIALKIGGRVAGIRATTTTRSYLDSYLSPFGSHGQNKRWGTYELLQSCVRFARPWKPTYLGLFTRGHPAHVCMLLAQKQTTCCYEFKAFTLPAHEAEHTSLGVERARKKSERA